MLLVVGRRVNLGSSQVPTHTEWKLMANLKVEVSGWNAKLPKGPQRLAGCAKKSRIDANRLNGRLQSEL